MPETTDPKRKNLKLYAAIFGVALAVVCRALPAEYHHPCEALARVCTGGLYP